MTSFGLWPLSKGYSREYLNSVDPRVANEFSTAAFRYKVKLVLTTPPFCIIPLVYNDHNISGRIPTAIT